MRIAQSYKRNNPSTVQGESISIIITCSSYDKQEIDELEKKIPKGLIITDNIDLLTFVEGNNSNEMGRTSKQNIAG